MSHELLPVTSKYHTVYMGFTIHPSPVRQSHFSLYCLYFPSSLTTALHTLPPRPWTGLSWTMSRTVTPLFHHSIILFAPLQIWVFICPSICLLPLAWQVEMTMRDSEARKEKKCGNLWGEGGRWNTWENSWKGFWRQWEKVKKVIKEEDGQKMSLEKSTDN